MFVTRPLLKTYSNTEDNTIKIIFERSGGFAGLRIKTEMDTGSLAIEQATAIHNMIQEAGFFDLPAVVAASKLGADRFQYNLTIEENGKRHSVVIHDNETMPESLKPLLRHLTELARSPSRH
ncbi:MAG: protealysin inhibitor emfourin [Gammaproteobacteria bacterium]